MERCFQGANVLVNKLPAVYMYIALSKNGNPVKILQRKKHFLVRIPVLWAGYWVTRSLMSENYTHCNFKGTGHEKSI
jgi:hypothetical protein